MYSSADLARFDSLMKQSRWIGNELDQTGSVLIKACVKTGVQMHSG